MARFSAQRRRVPHLWMFVLLGQIVAISFAENLPFLAFTVFGGFSASQSATSTEQTGTKEGTARQSEPPTTSSWLSIVWLVVLAINLGCAIAIPGNIGHPNFMYLLLTPHIIVFAPLLMNGILAAPKAPIFSQQLPFVVRAGEMVSLPATAIRNVMSEGEDSEQIRTALYEHPAVSSVGWDAMCCWLSFSAWTILG
ncbi:alpha-mannosyltransferase alg11p [Fusarium albosuccineum]|uniref:Alpha-mannosyltransferase alg11p n=1 Tax=Fusarium albosuccineum TaxID=1237068 RepID=A0A8H4KSD9_9HYPO|nr:alpha-mannosyltransferase alg11p [Fusarium albosuccineum]